MGDKYIYFRTETKPMELYQNVRAMRVQSIPVLRTSSIVGYQIAWNSSRNLLKFYERNKEFINNGSDKSPSQDILKIRKSDEAMVYLIFGCGHEITR